MILNSAINKVWIICFGLAHIAELCHFFECTSSPKSAINKLKILHDLIVVLDETGNVYNKSLLLFRFHYVYGSDKFSRHMIQKKCSQTRLFFWKIYVSRGSISSSQEQILNVIFQ